MKLYTRKYNSQRTSVPHGGVVIDRFPVLDAGALVLVDGPARHVIEIETFEEAEDLISVVRSLQATLKDAA